ncbi:MAG: ribosomal protein S18-alanine N-acetyltransferase, partial [Thermomicrobiales bacterium]
WPLSAYRRELRFPEQNYYIVLRAIDEPDSSGFSLSRNELTRRAITRLVHPFARKAEELAPPHIAGFAGMWVMYEEAHVTTIGTDPTYRGRGLGELMLVALFDEAIRRGASMLTLEVRVSNDVAQRLYEKYGMSSQGIRARYYTDNGEDAYIMWSKSLRDPEYVARIEELRVGIVSRLEPHLSDTAVFALAPVASLPDTAS